MALFLDMTTREVFERTHHPTEDQVIESHRNFYPLSDKSTEGKLSMRDEAKRIRMPEDWMPPEINGDWRKKSFVSIDQLTATDIEDVIQMAENLMDADEDDIAQHRQQLAWWLHPFRMQTAFYEASTRTRTSFEAAAQTLGVRVISSPDMIKMSSYIKGETVADNAKTMAMIASLIVQRHPDVGAARVAAFAVKDMVRANRQVPQIINAGDGIGEHPTQALLDITTWFREKKIQDTDELKGQNVAFVGDIKNGRTIHSLLRVIECLGGCKTVYLVSPKELSLQKEMLDRIITNGQKVVVTEELEEPFREADVVYVTRVQKERFEDPGDYDRIKDMHIVSPKLMEIAKSDMILMHPLPRVNEIEAQVDLDPRAVYFQQVENGLYVRMALLCLMTGRPFPNLPYTAHHGRVG